MEELILHYLKNVMVTMPVEVVEVNETNNLCTVKPLIFNNLELPLIVNCPFLPIGNKTSHIKFKVEKGQKFQALFSQLDLSNYISKAQEGQVNSVRPFSFTNCVILPIMALTEIDNIAVPSVNFEILGNMKITGDIEHTGKYTHNGDTEQTGNVTQDGKYDATGIINSDSDVTAAGISLVNHTHNYRPGSGNPTPTQKPQ